MSYNTVMDFGFVEQKTLYLIGHLFGVALGAGGAFISDLLFLKSVRDRKISKTEIGFLSVASYAVTAGLVLLIGSGVLMFMLEPEKYLASAKFITKMSIVGIIVLNGVFLHWVHIPWLRRQVGARQVIPHEFSYRLFMLLSGTVSLVSWSSAIILGAFRSIPLEYGVLMSIYGAVLGSALCVAYLLRDHLVPSFARK